MPQPDWEVLVQEFRDLQARVASLEKLVGVAGPALKLPAPLQHAANLPHPAALLPVIGRGLLGLAGAYLLRALTESATIPMKAGVAIGIVYAILWLVWAARTPAGERLETAIHSLTSVLVIAPLLWEATVRFHAVSTWAAGAILVGFTIFGLAVSWRKDLLIVATFATLAGLGTATGLLLATHDAIPFTLVFLAIAAAVEISACLNHWLSERWLAATAADLAVLLATWLVTREGGLPEVYAPISHGALLGAQMALVAIYLCSTIVRTLFRGTTFTGFETAQCALVFAISVGGGLRLTSADPRITSLMAFLTLSCAAACYGVSFLLLDRGASRIRNFYTYATFGLLLTITGSRILLTGMPAWVLWWALAVACVWGGGFSGRRTLQVHGVIYLLLALGSSGALRQTAEFVLGTASWPGRQHWAIWMGILTGAICYILVTRPSHSERAGWSSQALPLAVTGTMVWLAIGIGAGLVTAGYTLAFGDVPSQAYSATLRTGVLAAASALLAWAGSRWRNPEFSRLTYPIMALGGYRLLIVDLRQDRTAALFLSLLLYGTALMVLPRFKLVPRSPGIPADVSGKQP